MSARLTVVGLGPAGPDLATIEARAAIEAIAPRFVRTTRHPSASLVEPATSFDSIYEQAETIDEVYASVVDALLAAAQEHGEVLYAVPGSPDVAERTVALLREAAARGAIDLSVLPALSFVDLAWSRLGVDPLAAGAQLIDGRRFAVEAAGGPGPLLVGQVDSPMVLSDIKLAVGVEADPRQRVVVLHHLGLPDERVVEIEWVDLDRVVQPDHLTSLWIPQLSAPVAAELQRLDNLVWILREQCPWDQEQTHDSLAKHLVEETHEVLAAIDHLDPDDAMTYDDLEEELGDLLYQVLFHAVLAGEAGWFTLADVARNIHDKLYERHPHVFGDVEASDADAVRRNWEQIKKAQKQRTSLLDGIPAGLPALLLALKVQKKARTVGMDFADVEEVYRKIEEELAEVRADPSEAEVGDLLFAVTAAAMHLSVDPETALRRAADRFSRRFRTVESLAAQRDLDLGDATPARLDELWQEAKAREAGTSDHTGSTG